MCVEMAKRRRSLRRSVHERKPPVEWNNDVLLASKLAMSLGSAIGGDGNIFEKEDGINNAR